MSGCSSDGFLVVVDVKTDLVAGVEVDSFDVELYSGSDSSSGAPIEELRAGVDETADFLSGVRIAEWSRVQRGEHRVRLIARRRGQTVQERDAVFHVRGTTGITMLLTRDCRDVDCSEPDNALLLTCIGGSCIDARCTPETPEYCEPECTAATDCEEGAACSEAACLEGACFLVADPSRCEAEEWCSPDQGCLAFPSDGGVADAGTDASDAMTEVDASTSLEPVSAETVWLKHFGGTGQDMINGIVLDGAGGVVIAGKFEQTVDFGAGAWTTGADDDAVLASYARADGSFQWAERFGATTTVNGNGLCLDSVGNLYLTGLFYGDVDFGGGVLSTGDASWGDIFVASFDSSGGYRWAYGFGDAERDNAFSAAWTGNSPGHLLVAAEFSGTADPGSAPLTSAGGTDILVARYDASGVNTWAQLFGDTSADGGWGVAGDADGNVYVTGVFKGTVDFGGEVLGGATGDGDPFLASFDSSGAHRWSRSFGSTNYEHGSQVLAGQDGQLFWVGSVGDVDLGEGPIAPGTHLMSFDVADGSFNWSEELGSTEGTAVTVVAQGASGNLYVTGRRGDRFNGSLYAPVGESDAFVGSFSSSGTLLWWSSLGGAGDESGRALAVDEGENALYLAGWFDEELTIDGTTLVPAGDWDIFLARFAIP